MDWQFTCASTPYLDIAAMVFMNQDTDTIKKNAMLFLKAYYDKFVTNCQKFNVKAPWCDFQDFHQPAISQGILDWNFPLINRYLMLVLNVEVFSDKISLFGG